MVTKPRDKQNNLSKQPSDFKLEHQYKQFIPTTTIQKKIIINK